MYCVHTARYENEITSTRLQPDEAHTSLGSLVQLVTGEYFFTSCFTTLHSCLEYKYCLTSSTVLKTSTSFHPVLTIKYNYFSHSVLSKAQVLSYILYCLEYKYFTTSCTALNTTTSLHTVLSRIQVHLYTLYCLEYKYFLTPCTI